MFFRQFLYLMVILCFVNNSWAAVFESHVTKGCDGGPPTYMSPERCCKFPEFSMDEHYENCIEDLNLEPATTHEEEDDLLEDSCVIECVFNRTNLTELNKDLLVKEIKGGIKDISGWNSKADQMVSECLADLTTTNLKELQKEVLKELKAIGAETRRVCDLRYTLFIDCLYIKLFQECPINRFKSTKKCNNLLSHVQRCDDWY